MNVDGRGLRAPVFALRRLFLDTLMFKSVTIIMLLVESCFSVNTKSVKVCDLFVSAFMTSVSNCSLT